jgi:hypothetical protein
LNTRPPFITERHAAQRGRIGKVVRHRIRHDGRHARRDRADLAATEEFRGERRRRRRLHRLRGRRP